MSASRSLLPAPPQSDSSQDEEDESSGFYLSHLFDEDASLAAVTGFRLWEASAEFVRLIDGALQPFLSHKACVELGSGTGLVGLCAAAVGAHVLLTDVPTVVRDATAPNVARNARLVDDASRDGCGTTWEGAVSVGLGSAAVVPLDWTKPVDAQVGWVATMTQMTTSSVCTSQSNALCRTCADRKARLQGGGGGARV